MRCCIHFLTVIYVNVEKMLIIFLCVLGIDVVCFNCEKLPAGVAAAPVTDTKLSCEVSFRFDV